ncbi:MAG: LeuA family protein [Actinobacteria bacterium]|nr:LeuA family protein [Actinomycetota bacterium]MCL5447277.1 LeuA family protein [Actinomycetota bacterium]
MDETAKLSSGSQTSNLPEFSELVFDWNQVDPPSCSFEPPSKIILNDETLRDGLQSPSTLQPTLAQKQVFLRLLPALGIHSADIGYAGAGSAALSDVVKLAETIRNERLSIEANCAGRTHIDDINPILEACQRSGLAIRAALFLGSSPIRQLVEGWDLDYLVETATRAIGYARSQGVEVMFVTEDTTRARPGDLSRLYRAAADAGAARVCVSDTVGQATPVGVQRVISFLRKDLDEAGFPAIEIDYHGHRDRGLDLINNLMALSAGATRVHACALGVGERVGNAVMDTLVVNLVLLGWMEADLTGLPAYCELASEMTGFPIARNYPVVGEDAFTTSTGVHAAAVAKAYEMGEAWLADRIYSAVPAGLVGREQRILVGPMSGRWNALFWLRQHGIEESPELVSAILDVAKRSTHVLHDDEAKVAVELAMEKETVPAGGRKETSV